MSRYSSRLIRRISRHAGRWHSQTNGSSPSRMSSSTAFAAICLFAVLKVAWFTATRAARPAWSSRARHESSLPVERSAKRACRAAQRDVSAHA